MRIAISGASGYIGQHLSSFLEGKGYDVIPLGRDLFKEDCFDELCRCVESCEVVINLALPLINVGRRLTNKSCMIAVFA